MKLKKMHEFEKLVNDLYKYGQETSKHYKAYIVVPFVKTLINEGYGDHVLKSAKNITISEYYDQIKHLKNYAFKTSKRFKTIYFKEMFDLINRENTNKKQKQEQVSNLVEKKIENIEKIQRTFLEMLVAQSIVIKALVKEVGKKKTKETIDDIVDSFDYGMKYDLPFDKLKGKSFYIGYDDELLNEVKKLLRKIV